MSVRMRRGPNIQHCYGVRDGILDALLCLLGPERGAEADGKYPIERNYFEGVVPDDLHEWAEQWVGAILDQKAEESEGVPGSFYESLIKSGIR